MYLILFILLFIDYIYNVFNSIYFIINIDNNYN